MRRVGNIFPSIGLGQIKSQAMFWRNSAQIDMGSATGGEDAPAYLDRLLIDSKAGIASAKDHQWVLLK
jgi:hypothetical protein